jgi:hypothetical protein
MIERFEEIDGYTVIRGVERCPLNPEATKAAAEEAIKKNPDLKKIDLNTLYEMYEVCSDNLGPGKKHITEAKGAVFEEKLDEIQRQEQEQSQKKEQRQGRQLLTEEAGVVPDLRGVEYWQKTNGRWAKTKIEHINEMVPSGAILPDLLTGDQRSEIAAQEQADRIAALSPDEKEEEKQAQIKAVIKEALTRKQEAELEAEVNDTPVEFDHVAWARERKAEIETQYA